MSKKAPHDYVKEYCNAIRSGEIVVSKYVRKWYLEHIEPIIDGKSEKWEYKPRKGEKYILFAETFCKQSKGRWSGKPFKMMLFQKAKYQAFFSIVDRKTGKRRFKELFDERGRKNGKTTELAPFALWNLLSENGAEFYSSATTRQQAMRLWEETQNIIDQDENLTECFGYKVFPQPEIYTKPIVSAVKSKFMVLANKPKNLDGLNASGGAIDETHEMPREIYDILKQSMSTREEPILALIGSAGFKIESLFTQERDYAIKVIDGTAEDDTFFPLLHELDSPEEINDESSWVKANPAIDVIKSREELRQNVKRAMTDLSFANSVKVKDFNILGVDDKAWLDAQTIIKGAYAKYDENEVGLSGTEKQEEFIRRFDGQIVIGAYDLSRTGDMTAFSILLFDGDTIIVKPMYWVTRKFLESPACIASHVPFKAWIDRGLVRIAGDNEIDYHKITEYIMEQINEHGYIFNNICYDPYSAVYLTRDVEALGFDPYECLFKVSQTYKTLSVPTQNLQTMLLDGKICYLNNPVFKWNLANCQTITDGKGNFMIAKVNDKPENKIDGVATALDAIVKFFEDPNVYTSQAPKSN